MIQRNPIDTITVDGLEVSVQSVDMEQDIERNVTPVGPNYPDEYSVERVITTTVTFVTDGKTDLPQTDTDVKLVVRDESFDLDGLTMQSVEQSFWPGKMPRTEETYECWKQEIEHEVVEGKNRFNVSYGAVR